MKFDVISLFPELISPYFEDSILKRARDKKIIDINFHQLRDYTKDKHRQVDDTPYGGGSGMLIKADVLTNAVDEVSKLDKIKPYVIYLSPQGKKLNNKIAKEFAKKERIVLVCGRYEGIDQRFIDSCVDEEISIGDYVLSGGELPAAVFIESVSRFIPGVVGDHENVINDSFENGRMKYPQYTKPREFNGSVVPEVLLSGNHKDIAKWREEKTKVKNIKDFDIYMSLLHYPVKNKNSEIISTAVTNLDIHDIARLSATFGLKRYYIITPILEQQALVKRILEHWDSGYGSNRNTNRSQAISNIEISPSLEETISQIEKRSSKKVKLVTTSARLQENYINIDDFVSELDDSFSYLIVFGTGWGISDEILKKSDYILERLSYDTGYNHLSVRSAVSIVLDRLYNSFGRVK
jgi:tRNA (guanine37-N1)-methyltransferase